MTQTAIENNNDTLASWSEVYFAHAVTTAETSRRIQMRDLGLFLKFAYDEGVVMRPLWSPRLSRAFQDFLKKFRKEDGTRRWSDRTGNRILAHVKTLARQIHHLAPFPLGNPMQEIRLMAAGANLDAEKALTPAERRRILDASDLLTNTGGRSKDRRRRNRPARKSARPWRNRAMVYTTGMRRAGVVNLDLEGVDWGRSLIRTVEKGGVSHKQAGT